MGIKSLLIVLVILGAEKGIESIIASTLIFIVVLFNLGIKFFLKSEKGLPVSLILTAILACTISIFIKKESPIWHRNYQMFIYSLPIISVVVYEEISKKSRNILKETYIFLQGMISIGILKELLAYGTIFNFKIIKNYEGILYFNTSSSTVLLIVFVLIIYNKVGDNNDKNY